MRGECKCLLTEMKAQCVYPLCCKTNSHLITTLKVLEAFCSVQMSQTLRGRLSWWPCCRPSL